MSKSGNNSFQKVRAFMQRYAMLEKVSGVVIGVSGGADSVMLLDIFVRLREILARQREAKELKLHVAHLNHLLRGSESDADAEFVLKLCERFAVAATLQAIDVQIEAETRGKGIEETARQLRYSFFLEVAKQEGCDRIATGHTMSDQAETFVMRLARGAGLRGLVAMRPIVPAHRFGDAAIIDEDAEGKRAIDSNVENENDSSMVEKGEGDKDKNAGITPSPLHPFTSTPLLIRPLLCITREEVEAYCDTRGLQFRTDVSNESLTYTRNRVRHLTMKALREINPKVVEHIAQTAEIIADEQDTLAYLTVWFLEQAEISSEGWEKQNSEWSNRKAYSLEMFLRQPAGLRRRMIVEAIRRERVRAQPLLAQTSEIEFVHIEAVEKLLTESSSGHRVMLPCGLQVWREFEALVLLSAANEGSTAEAKDLEQSEHQAGIENLSEPWLCKAQASVEVAGFKITILREQPGSRWRAILEEARVERARAGVDWKIAALDDSLLPEKLFVRARRKGETVRVFGQRKNIKLKKLMIDHKIASSRRAVWPIVVTSDGEYVWSPGLPPALTFTANDKTQTLAILRASDV